MKIPEQYIGEVTAWAKSRNDINSLVLVGSYARKQARPDSDIDFVVVCQDKDILLKNTSWIHVFGEVTRFSLEEWGKVTSVRVFYLGGLEIEFGIVSLNWCDVPVDAGTYRVVSDGMLILKDTNNQLENVKDNTR
jgi:predicted nucleotidyltransferase